MPKSKPIVGFTCGCFDIMHYGYILMFKECKKHCDHLIVGLAQEQKETKAPLVNDLRVRLETLKAIRYVDEILVYEGPGDLGPLLLEVVPDVRLIGADYIGQDFDAREICKELGVEIIYTPRYHNYSLTNLKTHIRINEALGREK